MTSHNVKTLIRKEQQGESNEQIVRSRDRIGSILVDYEMFWVSYFSFGLVSGSWKGRLEPVELLQFFKLYSRPDTTFF